MHENMNCMRIGLQYKQVKGIFPSNKRIWSIFSKVDTHKIIEIHSQKTKKELNSAYSLIVTNNPSNQELR